MIRVVLIGLCSILCFFGRSQELSIYETRDSYNPRLFPGIKTFKASAITGINRGYQYRNFFQNDFVNFNKVSLSAFLSIKDTSSVISGFQLDWKYMQNINLTGNALLDTTFGSVASSINTFQTSFYLNAVTEETARYRFSWNQYRFKGNYLNEYSVEVDIRLPAEYLNGGFATGGFIFTRVPELNQNYYGIGYRYDIVQSKKGHNVRMGIGYTRNWKSGNDKGGKFKLEFISRLSIYRNFSLNLYTAYSRIFLVKSDNFELGTFFLIPAFRLIRFPQFYNETPGIR